MDAKTFEFIFDIDNTVDWPDAVPDPAVVAEFFKNWIAKKFFQDEINDGLQQLENVCIALLTYDDDEAEFEVIDGYASPCLRYSPKQFVIDN